MATTQAALVVWDHFDAPPAGQFTTLGTSPTTYTGTFGGIAGVDRTVTLTHQGGPTTYTAGINVPSPDKLDINSAVNANGKTDVTYSKAGGLNLDGTPYLGWQFDDFSNDNNGAVAFTVTIATDGVGASTWVGSIASGASNVAILIPWAAFVGVADISNIDWVQFTFDTPASGDMDLHAIDLVIPEPGDYALLAGLGLVGFGAWRRFRKA